MGNIATFGAGAKAVAGSSIPALHSATSLIFYRRMKVDPILTLSAFGSLALGQVDDGTDANARVYVYASDNNGPKSITMFFGPPSAGIGSVSTGSIPLASWPVAGSYIVIYIGYNKAADQRVFGIFDGSGTNTLADGQPKGTSVFWGTSSYNTVLQSHTADGIVQDAYAQTGSAGGQVVDATAWYTGIRTANQEDAIPSLSEALPPAGAWFYDDTIGATSFANLVGGGPALVASGTVTLSAGGTVGPTTSTPTTVVATPSSIQVNLPAGTTGTVALATDDQTGAAMPTRTWGIVSNSNTGVATGSITGSTLTVTAVASGQCQITINDTASGGSGATDAVVTVTVGTQYDWVSANTGLVTVGTGAATETLTDPPANTSTAQTSVTVTRHGTSASGVIIVNSAGTSGGGSGSGNEPSGMTVGLNTGSLTVPPVTPTQVAGGTTTWNVGTTLVTQFQQFSPGGAAPAIPYTGGATSGWAGNLTLCPDGPGYRITYPSGYGGGFSPVRFGAGIALPPSPTGIGYYSAWVRFSAQGGAPWNWNLGGVGGTQVSMKLWEPRTRSGDTNHIFRLAVDPTGGTTQGYANLVLQGPGTQNSDFPNVVFGAWSASTAYNPGDTAKSGGLFYVCILANTNQLPPNATYWVAVSPGFSYLGVCPNAVVPTDGNWHHLESLQVQDSPAGSGNGTFDAWVDGTHAFRTPQAGMNYLAAGDAFGWPFWMFDPVWGGGAGTPLETLFYDIDRLYMSQK